MTKWGDRPHWEMDAVYLGSDEAGDWLGFPVGTVMSRPGVTFTTEQRPGRAGPAAGTAVGQAWLATFHGPGGSVWTYVDMTTVPAWDGRTVRAVDLDLDVIERLDRRGVRRRPGRVRRAPGRVLGYPREVVDLAMATRDLVHIAVRDKHPPFDGSAAPWFDVLRRADRVRSR